MSCRSAGLSDCGKLRLPRMAIDWAISMHFDNWVLNQAFGASAEAPVIIRLQTQQNALSYLRSIVTDEAGVRVLCGPAESGKSTIVRCFAEDLPSDAATAVVDAAGSTGHGLLSRILAQFGYRVELPSTVDLLRMLNVFAVQQTRAVQPPIIIIENFEKMQLGALRALAVLATLRFQGQYAARIVLTGRARVLSLLKSKSLAPVSERVGTIFEVEPLSAVESMLLLHGRLTECGIQQADEILPISVCDCLHEMSGGLPGLLIQNARTVIERAGTGPVKEEDVRRHQGEIRNFPTMPRLIVTSNGKAIEELEFKERKVTLGRSNICDIVIYNEFASKFHALLILYADALILVDLNSSNGTFVNSARVSSTILRSNDIISLADYRIKVLDAPEPGSDQVSAAAASDTSKMKTLDEVRREKQEKQRRLVGQQQSSA